MAQQITPAQLDALERGIDKIFAKYGIDVEFTQHFLDRVNDPRNRQQITLEELANLFVKEYKRWGRTIGGMDISAQAVMKDLSSAINVPFVMTKDDKGKDLVAKTIMRKKNFKTPNRELPVESAYAGPTRKQVNQYTKDKKSEKEWYAKHKAEKDAEYDAWVKAGRPNDVDDDIEEGFSGKTFGGGTSHGNWGSQVNKASKEAHKKAAEKRKKSTRITPDTLNAINKKLGNIKEETHVTKKGTQAKGKDVTPKKSKPTAGNETPHPMRGKLVGEGYTFEQISKDWGRYQVDERILDLSAQLLSKALQYMDSLIKSRGDQQTLEGYAFEIYKSFNLENIASVRELAQLYRDWQGNV